MTRHLRWLIPLLLVPLTYVLAMLGVQAIQQQPTYESSTGLILGAGGLLVLAVLGPLAAAIVALVGGITTLRRWRKRSGHLNKMERAAAVQQGQRDVELANAWTAASGVRQLLMKREVPPAITVWEVVPNAGELMFFDVRADYARYYGTDVSYSQSSGFFFGHPAFVIAGLAATTIGNIARRSAAQTAAHATWREWQPVRVLISNQRIMCHAGGQWLSFYYSAMTAVYPEAEKWTIICEFGGKAEPLMLSGDSAALISTMTVLMTHGVEAVEAHPSLQRLV